MIDNLLMFLLTVRTVLDKFDRTVVSTLRNYFLNGLSRHVLLDSLFSYDTVSTPVNNLHQWDSNYE